ncbi:MAG: 2-oxo acid dehydrogenase subunit E2 [Ruminiclostridium sp.]|nr:2-oxo acid dehydrogenase subunit E2 [Ruminiclostridium sp.]
MAFKVIMPKQGLQMTEGTITRWHFAEGDRVEIDKPLFEMETDKLNIEITAQASGTLLKILKGEGEIVPITEIIAVIGEPGEDISDILTEPGSIPPETAHLNEEAEKNTSESADTVVSGKEKETDILRDRIFITPRAKSLLQEKSLDYTGIKGSGPEGLIIERDVLNQRNGRDDTVERKGKMIPFNGMRKVISDRMLHSLHTMAQANHRMKVDMTEIIRLREKLKADNKKVSITDIFIKIVSKVLREYPILNSSLTDEGILIKDDVNIGLAVALDNGLIVPVIKNADLMTLEEISRVSSELVEKAKKGGLKPDEYTGGTFTVSNLGMFEIDEFTAIINPPESAILAIGKIDRIPVAEGDGIVIKPIVVLSLTYDHRIINGAPAAMFLQRIKHMLQNPYILI